MQLAICKDLELISYKYMRDEEVVEASKSNCVLAMDHLIHKYQNLVRGKARSYYLIGADNDDIVQEGLIGLYKAIQDYDKDKLTSFKVFAEICITRQIITAIKTATRQKHIPLNSYVSLNKPMYHEEAGNTLLDVIAGLKITNPEDLMISREELEAMEKKTEELLSKLELKVFGLYVEGMSYQEIAEEMDRHIKCVDNALQRVKKKLDKYLEEGE